MNSSQRLRIDFLVAVWGDWHISALTKASFPSLMAETNLPQLARRHECRILIMTRRADAARLESDACINALRSLLDVEIVVQGEDATSSGSEHHLWWRCAVEAARERNAKVVFLHPDVVWAAGALSTLESWIMEGAAVLMPPNLRVVSETLMAEISTRFGSVVDLSPNELVEAGFRHLHPLSGMTIPGAPAWIPASERLWPVVAWGGVSRVNSRPVIAFDPVKCEISAKSFVQNLDDFTDVYPVRHSNEVMFLSLAPFMKDIGLLVQGHEDSSLEGARWSVNPGCDVAVNRLVPAVSSLLQANDGPAPTRRLRKAEREARRFMGRLLRYRDLVKVWLTLRERGHSRLCGLLALAAHEAELHTVLRGVGGMTIFVPSERALERRAQVLNELAEFGNEARLRHVVGAHVFEDEATPDQADGPRRMSSKAKTVLWVDWADEGAEIGGAKWSGSSYRVSGHVIHVIEDVLGLE